MRFCGSKKGASGNFDTPIRVYDGAMICKLVGCLLLISSTILLTPATMAFIKMMG